MFLAVHFEPYYNSPDKIYGLFIRFHLPDNIPPKHYQEGTTEIIRMSIKTDKILIKPITVNSTELL